MLLALLHPDVYETIAKGTRRHYANNKPRAVLFEGPPGTGKTTSARSAALASQLTACMTRVSLALLAVMSYHAPCHVWVCSVHSVRCYDMRLSSGA